MFKQQYKQLNLQINPDKELVQSAVRRAKVKGRKSVKQLSFRKAAVAIVSICLVLCVAMPAAAGVEPVYQIMYAVSPAVAQFFVPVKMSSEDNGIKMEVISAYIHENTAEIYISMEDMTGSRIDETTDLYDSYSINRPFNSSASCRLVNYDEATKKAEFLIYIEEWGNRDISGDKITFSVREFLSNKKEYNNTLIPVELSKLSDSSLTQQVESSGGGGLGFKDLDNESITALIPTGAVKGMGIEGIELTAIGYVEGKLHVQTGVKNRHENDNHGYVYLVDSNGEVVDNSYSVYFSKGQTSYCEHVFDIPQSAIGDYKLMGDFVISGSRTTGNWRLSFPLEKEGK